VNGAIFLNVAPVFDDYFAPIAPNGSARSYIDVFANNHVTRNRGLRMDETAFVYHGGESVEFVYHFFMFQVYSASLHLSAIASSQVSGFTLQNMKLET
jgi:hypothetical protein